MSDTNLQKSIQNRQLFYFQGNQFEEQNELSQAIESYLKYSKVLDSEDQHIPHLWISKLYTRLNDEEKSLSHLELFGNGCSDTKKIEVYKDIGERYERLGNYKVALEFFEKATAINSQIGLKAKIENLKKLLN